MPRVPNVFHFVFGLKPRRERFHLMHYLCLESCLQVNDPDAVYLHLHREPTGSYWRQIRDRITTVPIEIPVDATRLRYRDRYTARYRYAHQTDFVRLEILRRHGGIYADLDTLFVSPLSKRLREAPFVLGREDDIVDQATGCLRPSLCNAFLIAEPGSEFARIWLDSMGEAFDGSWSAHSTLLPQRLSREHPEKVHIEPSRTFYPFMWSQQGLRALFEEHHSDLGGVSSMHLWAHLWWSRLRRDFSTFHAGRLSEAYVRAGETTYAAAAKPFLEGTASRGGNP